MAWGEEIKVRAAARLRVSCGGVSGWPRGSCHGARFCVWSVYEKHRTDLISFRWSLKQHLLGEVLPLHSSENCNLSLVHTRLRLCCIFLLSMYHHFLFFLSFFFFFFFFFETSMAYWTGEHVPYLNVLFYLFAYCLSPPTRT